MHGRRFSPPTGGRSWLAAALALTLSIGGLVTLASAPATAGEGVSPTLRTSATTAQTTSPFAGRTLYVDPDSNARRAAADARARGDETSAVLFDRIGDRSQADWFGDWNPISSVRSTVRQRVDTITAAGAYPVLVLYAIPLRDCGGYSGGGMGSADAYRTWVREVAAGIGDRAAAVVLEPDSLALMDCLSEVERDERLALLRESVAILGERGDVAVYLDGGHSNWHAPRTMANRLRDADVHAARGFALNVSNFRWTEQELAYGRDVSQRLDGTHFVIDTSRNGQGPHPDDEWCNPAGRGLGPAPRTADTGDLRTDALLWIKRPGESDGDCSRGEPTAGAWWPEYALALAEAAAPEPSEDDGGGSEPVPGDGDDGGGSEPVPGDGDDDGESEPVPGDGDDDGESEPDPVPGDEDDDTPDEDSDDEARAPGRGGGNGPPASPPGRDKPQGGTATVQAACGDAAPSAGFADLRGSVHRSAADCLSRWRITSGVAPGRFAPGEAVTRAQMATFLDRTLRETALLPAHAPARSFRDVPRAHTHREGIERLAGLGVVAGTTGGRFAPDSAVTRGQVASLLVRLHEEVVGAPVTAAPDGFRDVRGGPHEHNVRKLVALGVTSGHPDGTFRASQPVTRGQMATFLVRYLDRLVAEGHAAPRA
jgi:endoglucanase